MIGSFRQTTLNNVTLKQILEYINSGFHEFSVEDRLLKPDFNKAEIEKPNLLNEATDVNLSVSWKPIWSETLDKEGRKFPILEYTGIAFPEGNYTLANAYVIVVCKVFPPDN